MTHLISPSFKYLSRVIWPTPCPVSDNPKIPECNRRAMVDRSSSLTPCSFSFLLLFPLLWKLLVKITWPSSLNVKTDDYLEQKKRRKMLVSYIITVGLRMPVSRAHDNQERKAAWGKKTKKQGELIIVIIACGEKEKRQKSWVLWRQLLVAL